MSLTRTRALFAGLACILWLATCGEEVKRKKHRGAKGPLGMVASNLKKVGKPSPELRADAIKEKKKKTRKKRRRGQGVGIDNLPKPDEFAERDFIENEQESRDPFRNYLIKAPLKETAPLPFEDVVYLKSYPVAELKLTGIVGSRKRYAMILDPRTGRTTILGKRAIFAKERARIYEINRNNMVLLITRIRPGKKKIVERSTMYVNDQRKIIDIGSDTLRPDESGIRYSFGRKRQPLKPKAKEP